MQIWPISGFKDGWPLEQAEKFPRERQMNIAPGKTEVSSVPFDQARVDRLMDEAGIDDALRFTAAFTDGKNLWAYRWACDAKPPTLYFREDNGNLLVVSEPIDDKTKGWREVPKGCSLIAKDGSISVECLNEAMGRLAA